jgi:hypothetical protein
MIDHSSTANNNILNMETDQVMNPSRIIISYFTDLFLSDFLYLNQLHNPLTSTCVTDHSSAANNNIFNVETDQVMSLSTIIISYFTDLFLSDFYLGESVTFNEAFENYSCD